MTIRGLIINLLAAGAAVTVLPSCNGILSGIYDEPPAETDETVAGQLYIDASDWTEWHYIDFGALADLPEGGNPSALWQTVSVPLHATGEASSSSPAPGSSGIYTYWYDVYGSGLGVREFREYQPTAAQPEPDVWTLAVHRNNVRTHGCAVAATDFASLDELPSDPEYYRGLSYTPDEWNETDVWVIQDRMLSGLIGNQGITVNPVLSSWLGVSIPPIPPQFTLDSRVFIMRTPEGDYAALQLENYQNALGTKCHLTINYRYPL